MNIINNFLESEIMSQELYEAILKFITSVRIRNGEFEGNSYVVKKINQNNIIILREDIYQNGMREISYATTMHKNELLNSINDYAELRGLKVLKVYTC